MACAVGLLLAIAALGCPFCTALEPTLSSRRDAAAFVALGEVRAGEPAAKNDGAKPAVPHSIRLHHVLKGTSLLADRESIPAPTPALKPGTLVLVFGDLPSSEEAKPPGHALQFSTVPASEVGLAYFAAAPPGQTTAPERLKYFARFLEHADPLAAADAYQEFAHAPFGEVRQAAGALNSGKLAAWLESERVPPARKGFYALALALEPGETARARNRELLAKLVRAPADDFRSGFDGILGGYLLLAGDEGLDEIERRYLADPQAADGDVRHALAALRFYHEFGDGIGRERLAQSVRRVLARPEFAADVITDLARWQDWSAVEQIAPLYEQPAYADPAVRRAIVGYLLACPEPAAAAQLKRLRGLDPQGVAAAEQVLSRLGGSRQ